MIEIAVVALSVSNIFTAVVAWLIGRSQRRLAADLSDVWPQLVGAFDQIGQLARVVQRLTERIEALEAQPDD